MNSNTLFGPLEVSLLTSSHVPNVITKEIAAMPNFEDISIAGMKSEAIRLRDAGMLRRSKALVITGEGGGDNVKATETVFRGDRLTWITPDLCREYDLLHTEKYVKKIISELKVMKSSYPAARVLRLNGEFSVQLALYVSRVICST
jgi:hypothetical protein